MVPVVRALTAAHSHNIVHRDLKPDNIFVTDSGTVKVLDFGIAKLAQGGDDSALIRSEAAQASEPPAGAPRELTRRGILVGTLPYMSPEQWGGGGSAVDHQTDLWAAGMGLTLEQLHHEVRATIRSRAEIEDLHDARIADRRRRLGLVEEPLHHSTWLDSSCCSTFTTTR